MPFAPRMTRSARTVYSFPPLTNRTALAELFWTSIYSTFESTQMSRSGCSMTCCIELRAVNFALTGHQRHSAVPQQALRDPTGRLSRPFGMEKCMSGCAAFMILSISFIRCGGWIMGAEVLGRGDTHDLLGLVIIGSEVLIGERPIDTHAVFRFQLKIIGVVAGALRPPADGAATECDRVMPIPFARAMCIKRLGIIDRVGLVLDLPVVGLICTPFDQQYAARWAIFQEFMQKKKRTETWPYDDGLVAGVDLVSINERHCSPQSNEPTADV